MADTNEVVEEIETPVEESKDDGRDKEISKLRQELDKHKKRLSEVNSEAANYKRELKASKSQAEIAEMERNERQAEMENELKELRREKTISDYRGRFIGLGFDDDVALETANAFADGDTDTLFANFNSFVSNLKNAVTVKAMDSQKGLSVGNPPSAHSYTRAEIEGMSAEEINAHWSEIQQNIKTLR